MNNDSSVSNITNITSTASTPINKEGCHEERKWMFYLLSSFVTFLVALVISLVLRACLIIRSRNQSEQVSNIKTYEGKSHNNKRLLAIKFWAENLLLGRTKTGKCLVALILLISLASLGVYLSDAAQGKVEECIDWKNNVLHQIDFVFNLIFIAHFILRWIAAEDGLLVLFGGQSMVDYFTVPPAILSIFLNRTWLGFRSLRAFRLLSIPDILQYLEVIKTKGTVRLTELICTFVAILLASAGIVQWIEKSGDPFDFLNPHNITFGECVYLLIVTMSTVGYGDLVCGTVTGKIFIVFFIIMSLGFLASVIPKIMDVVEMQQKYSGHVQYEKGRKHVVICGHVTYESVTLFLKEFVAEFGENDLDTVFLSSNDPDADLEQFLKRHFKNAEYFKGSMMRIKDLKRVKLHAADACIILANKYCEDPNAEDSSNIMCVVSIKNYIDDIRIIIQLMRHYNKAHLLNIPSWDWNKGDDVICLSELKLGFIAQSCLAPGFSTLISNLFSMRSLNIDTVEDSSLNDYFSSTKMKTFNEKFSPSFTGLLFSEAVELCFVKLKILLIAIQVRHTQSRMDVDNILLNPRNSRIEPNTSGFFIATSSVEVKRVNIYCGACHEDIYNEDLIKKCNCETDEDEPSFPDVDQIHRRSKMPKNRRRTRMKKYSVDFGLGFHNPLHQSSLEVNKLELHSKKKAIASEIFFRRSIKRVTFAEQRMQSFEDVMSISNMTAAGYDSTGMFHWVSPKNIEDCILENRAQARLKHFRNHVIFCIFANPESPSLELRNFVMPLRASNLNIDDVKDIIFVGNIDYFRHDWASINIFPKIYFLEGSPFNRANLRAVHINNCSMCCILTAKLSEANRLYGDSEPVLATLNIKAMAFTYPGAHSTANIFEGTSAYEIKRSSALFGSAIPLLTDLATDSNAEFLDYDDNEDSPHKDLSLTEPFACGNVLTDNVLNALVSTTFFQQDSITLIRALVTGGITSELDYILGEGAGLKGGADLSSEALNKRDRCRIAQFSINDPLYKVLHQFADQGTYGDLFIKALRTYKMLCIGLYRLKGYESVFNKKRYVITNPPIDFELKPSDKIFALIQNDIDLTQKES